MFKMGELNASAAHFVLYYKDDDKHGNRYWLYRTWYDHGKHKKLVVRFADLLSITWFVNDFVKAHNEEKKGYIKFSPAEVDKWIADYLP